MVSSVHVHRSVAVLDDFKVCGKPCWVGGCRAGMLHGVSLHFAVWLFILAMGVVMCACLPLLFHRWTAPLPMEKKQAIRGAMVVDVCPGGRSPFMGVRVDQNWGIWTCQ